MIIDFHSHIFPDRIAESTVALLKRKSNFTAYTDGTEKALIKSMEENDVDISVNLPVLTNPTQFESVLNFAYGINETYKDKSRKIISFAGFHPDIEDVDKKMSIIKSKGFKGIKIHPEYQNTDFNDKKYVRIIESAKYYDLIVITHAGIDDAYTGKPVRCTPDMIFEVANKVKYNKLVLAHYGSNRMYEEVYEKLCDLDVYFDTAFTMDKIGEEMFLKILSVKDPNKILFATDSPWGGLKNDLKTFNSFDIPKEVKEKILYKNALKLLGI